MRADGEPLPQRGLSNILSRQKAADPERGSPLADEQSCKSEIYIAERVDRENRKLQRHLERAQRLDPHGRARGGNGGAPDVGRPHGAGATSPGFYDATSRSIQHELRLTRALCKRLVAAESQSFELQNGVPQEIFVYSCKSTPSHARIPVKGQASPIKIKIQYPGEREEAGRSDLGIFQSTRVA